MKQPKQPRAPKPLTFGSEDVLLPESGKYAGLHPADAEAQGLLGFVYRVVLRYPSGNFRDEGYIGQKQFASARHWSRYTTSGEMRARIEKNQRCGGLEIIYEILTYETNKKDLNDREDDYILAAKKMYGSRCCNRALSRGEKIKPNANRYSKRRPREPFGGSNVYECG